MLRLRNRAPLASRSVSWSGALEFEISVQSMRQITPAMLGGAPSPGRRSVAPNTCSTKRPVDSDSVAERSGSGAVGTAPKSGHVNCGEDESAEADRP